MTTNEFLKKASILLIGVLFAISGFAQELSFKQDPKKGLWGVSNSEGKWIVKPQYDSIVGKYLDGKAFILRKNGNIFDIYNSRGSRKESLKGFRNLNISERPAQQAVFINLNNRDAVVYFPDQDKVFSLTGEQNKIGEFTSADWSLSSTSYYSQESKELLKPFTHITTFSLPDGTPTEYNRGRELNENLYIMGTGGADYLFRQGETEPIGMIKRGNNYFRLDDNELIELESGKLVDPKGNIGEVISYYDPYNEDYRILAVKNLKTGKNILIDRTLRKIRDEEYDNVKVSRSLLAGSPQYYYIAQKDNNTYLIDQSGKKTMMVRGDGYIIRDMKNDNVAVFVDKDGKLGLMSGKWRWDGGDVLTNKKVILPAGDYDHIINLYIGAKHTPYWKIFKDSVVALYNSDENKMVIPFEKGYTFVGERGSEMETALYHGDLCIVKKGGNSGLWNLKLGKEVLSPASDNDIRELPDGYHGFKNKGVAYAPNGSLLKLAPCVDVYDNEWAHDAPYFFVKLTGLQGRPVEFCITVYNQNGSVYTGRDGKKCIYYFDKIDTPTSAIEYGPKVTAWIGSDIYVKPFSKITLKFVLSARDAKTKAPIPVKGDKTISRWYERTW